MADRLDAGRRWGGRYFIITSRPVVNTSLYFGFFLDCWAHEESKGWRYVNVSAEHNTDRNESSSCFNPASRGGSSSDGEEQQQSNNSHQKPQQITLKSSKEQEPPEKQKLTTHCASHIDEKTQAVREISENNVLIDLCSESAAEFQNVSKDTTNTDDDENVEFKNQYNANICQQGKREAQNKDNVASIRSQSTSSSHKCVSLIKTSCGDAHNIGLDIEGRAYSLPSPLDFDPFPNNATHKVCAYISILNHVLTNHI